MKRSVTLLRPDEAARQLGVSKSKANELMRLGVLPYVVVGRRRRVPLPALVAWIDANLKAGGADAGDPADE